MLSEFNSDSARKIAEEFCGNRAVVERVGRMIDCGRIPHAFIIEGADGLGKSTFARIIARGAMCRCAHPMDGECSHCRKLKEKIHPDLIYVQGSGKTNAIAIDAIRSMRKDSMTAPNEADKRVFILEDCDNMQQPAQNAFLKIFEEAPSHVIFIMTCKSAMSLLTTIRSRGQVLTLHPVDFDEGAEFICRLHPEIGKDEALQICEKSGGNIGEALRTVSNSGSDDFYDKADDIADAIIRAMCFGSELELAVQCSKIGKDRTLGGAVCVCLANKIRQSLMVSVGAQDTLNYPTQEVMRLGAMRSADVLMKYLDELGSLIDTLKFNISMPLFNTRLAVILQWR
jgi:hypothetical protein